MSDYRPKEGDRVRVVMEGTIGEVWHSGLFRLHPDNEATEFTVSPDRAKGFNLSIEKIEPPVETFKPGDVVVRKGSNLQRLITDDGWVAFGPGWSFPGTHMDEPGRVHTSEHYEKVNLG